MKQRYFIDENGNLISRYPGQPIEDGWTEITLDEALQKIKDSAPQKTIEQQTSKRDALLAATDWYVVRQAETGKAVPEDVLIYRQALRDVDQQPGWPTDINWPTLPSA